MSQKISQMADAGALGGSELVEVSKLSSTVTITGTGLSAQASDNSFNDASSGFIAAGFAVGDQVRVQGFTGNVVNNIFSAKVTGLTAGKMTIAGTDGDVIVDDAAGESVTITKWETKRAAASAFGVGIVYFAVAASDEITPLTTGAGKVKFHWPVTGDVLEMWAGLSVAQTGSGAGGIVTVDVNDGGASMLSTKITIDNGEETSLTAAAAPVMSDTAVTKGNPATVDIDQIGDGTAKGLKLYFKLQTS